MTQYLMRTVRVLALLGLVAGISATAEANLINTLDGNDCSGVFGQSFENCKIPSTVDPNESPVIIKFNIGGATEINSLFPSIDGSEFQLLFDFDNAGPDTSDTGDGRWVYTPGPGDPAISFYVAKGSNSFNLFSVDGDLDNCGVLPAGTCDTWLTPLNNGGQLSDLSHITFYDTTGGGGGGGGGGGQIPEPSTILLFGSGLMACALAAWRKRAAKK